MPMFSFFSLMMGAALAQDSAPADAAASEEDVKALRERVRLLEKAVDELRGAEEVVQEEIPLDLETRIHGYAAINLNYLEERKVLGFALDEMMFQYTANLDRKMTINTEFSLEPEEHEVDVGIEAMEIAINARPQLQVVAGAFHLPLSPWAVTASQGSYRYLPSAVPEALEEQANEEYLPIDQVGVQLRGTAPIGFWQLSYVGAVTNGRAPDAGSSPQWLDFDNNKALVGRIAIQAPNGLQLGVGGYYDRMDVHDESIELAEGEEADDYFDYKTLYDGVPEIIGGASVVWQGGPVELHSELYTTIHQVDGESYQSYCAFAVVGLPFGKVTPYLMGDLVIVDPDDPVYQIYDQTGPELEVLPGVRVDLGLHLAWKTQVEVAYELDSDSFGWGLQSQLAAGF